MIQNETILNVADNTGAKKVLVFGKVGAANRKYSNIGDIVIVTIKSAVPHGMVKKGTIHKAIIVRSKQGVKRTTGEHLKFDDNACVLIKEDLTPRGTRVFGPIAREIKDHGYDKITSMANEVL